MIYGEEDYEKSIQYARKGYSLAKIINSPRWIMVTCSGIAEGYANLATPDSALVYYQEAYTYSNGFATSKEASQAYIFRGLGRVHYLLNNKDLALSYLSKSLLYATTHSDHNLLASVCLICSDIYKGLNKIDSSFSYSKKALTSAIRTSPQDVLAAYKQLAMLYKGINNDSAVKYFELETALRDSLFTAKRRTEIASLSFNEEERQKELIIVKHKELEARNHNLQYAAIVIGLIAFVILFLLLSRSIIVKTKFVEFFAVLGLLAVFEFINLLIHPYLAHATNDSPVLMLLVLIAIGALLIPLHHKLEKFITKIMVEKNKKIRLAAAKKTIAKLEGESTN
jgi:tetratricopeptide (TPR) repeat protein